MVTKGQKEVIEICESAFNSILKFGPSNRQSLSYAPYGKECGEIYNDIGTWIYSTAYPGGRAVIARLQREGAELVATISRDFAFSQDWETAREPKAYIRTFRIRTRPIKPLNITPQAITRFSLADDKVNGTKLKEDAKRIDNFIEDAIWTAQERKYRKNSIFLRKLNNMYNLHIYMPDLLVFRPRKYDTDFRLILYNNKFEKETENVLEAHRSCLEALIS